MAKRLILMRHAKSSWHHPGLRDHERPLNARGQESAHALGDWLREKQFLPDETFCSTSERTRQTLAGLGKIGGSVTYLDSLYHASPETLLHTLQNARDDTVLMIAHNPGIALFAMRIVAQPPDDDRFDIYPTGATLVARFDITRWSEVGRSAGRVEAFTVPRDLTG